MPAVLGEAEARVFNPFRTLKTPRQTTVQHCEDTVSPSHPLRFIRGVRLAVLSMHRFIGAAYNGIFRQFLPL